MSPYSQEAWAQLGALLKARRVEIDTRYRNRSLFCRERQLHYRVVGDLEGARRTNFTADLLRAAEVAYGLARGAITTALSEAPVESLQLETPVAETSTTAEGVLLVPVPSQLSEAERDQVQAWASRMAEDLLRMRRDDPRRDQDGGAK
ncbi:hypothetical protein ACFY19_20920 [Streptosporangium saharense]|uniref:hypothetical protein n=1 Tax=Streptosporangium saharense TaxID=1706840 RepID=UPI0036AA0649